MATTTLLLVSWAAIMLLGLTVLCALIHRSVCRSRHRALLASVTSVFERHRVCHWLDFEALASLLRDGDVHAGRSTTTSTVVSVLWDGHLRTVWPRVLADLAAGGMQVHAEERPCCSARWCLGHGGRCGGGSVHILPHHRRTTTRTGPVLVADEGGRTTVLPAWMVGACPQLRYWSAGECFLRLPAFPQQVADWRTMPELQHTARVMCAQTLKETAGDPSWDAPQEMEESAEDDIEALCGKGSSPCW